MTLTDFGEALHNQALQNRIRYCVVISGDTQWRSNAANAVCSSYDPGSVIRISDEHNHSIKGRNYRSLPSNRAKHLLGQEFDAIIFECPITLDPDLLGVVGGTIKAGGLLILLIPNISQWSTTTVSNIPASNITDATPDHATAKTNHYIHRLVRIICKSNNCLLIEQGKALPKTPDRVASSKIEPPPGELDLSDQRKAVQAVKKVMSGQRRRPVVLLSDRGRGKSAALGIAAGQLLDGEIKDIGVTGFNRKSVDNVFKHAETSIAESSGQLQYFSSEKLVRKKANINMLLVDEAAAIPLPTLIVLLKRYPRIAFASTVHGYEGTGLGFMHRFKTYLDAHTRGWRRCHLNTPVRWAKNDPLEAFLYDLLLLNAEPAGAGAPQQPSKLKDVDVTTVAQSFLSSHENMLREVFGLLTQAHYRTRPSDLKHLLDAPDLNIHIATRGNTLLGIAVVGIEGGLNEEIAIRILANQRRPAGHLLPQLLCSQLGFLEAARLKTARVIRIAIKSEFQRQGVGKLMLKSIEQAYQEKVDLIGTTFGVSPSLLDFWTDNGFYPVRLGQRNSIYTGTRPCTLLKPLSAPGSALVSKASEKFFNNLRYQLLTTFSEIDPELIPLFYRATAMTHPAQHCSQPQLADLVGFAFANQPMDHITASLISLTENTLQLNANLLDSGQTRLMVEHILQSRPWKKCTTIPAPGDKKAGMAACREITRKILNATYPDATNRLLKELGLQR